MSGPGTRADVRRIDDSGPEQLTAMRALARRLWSWSSRWHPGELTWFWHEHGREQPAGRLARWVADNRPVAWAWARGSRLDLQLDPARLDLAGPVLDWFGGAGERAVTVLDAEAGLLRALERHGYRRAGDGPYFAHLRRPLDRLPEPRVPAGYTLRPATAADADARAAVHRAAFSPPGRPPVTLGGDGYRAVQRAPGYRPELDWLVEAADGTPAAFGLAWLDDRSGVAVLEPVGTDPGHRRRGLAGAASLAALRAARRLGGRHARVCARGDAGYPAALATYEALGFRRYARNVRLVHPG